MLVGSPDPTKKIKGETALTSETKTLRDRVPKEDEEFFAEYFRSREYSCLKLDKDSQEKPSKTSETPDYLLEKDGLRIYCEIKSMFEQEDFAKTHGISDRLKERLEKLPYPFDFHLRIRDRIELSSKREKDIVHELENCLQRLGNTPSFPIIIKVRLGDAEIKLISSNAEKHLRCLIRNLGGGEIKSAKRLRGYIKSAGSKFKNYCQDGNGYVLVIFNHNMFLHEQDFINSMYGDLIVTFTRSPEVVKESEPFYGPNKMLTPDKNTIISAIIMCEEKQFDNIHMKRFVVFHNPYTKYPLDQKIFADEHNKQRIPIKIRPEGIEFEWIGSEI